MNELLELVHLEKFQTRYPAQLSGGQRQRMALARALAVEPRVLLLDEPFGALDAQVRKELRAWLRRLHDEMHVTTVIVTHDQEEAMEVADEIVVLQDGRVQQVGHPSDVYEHPANDWVMSFLGPVTHFGDVMVRPHDLDLAHEPSDGAVPATVVRVTRLGFQTRVDMEACGGVPIYAQLAREATDRLTLEPGTAVHVRHARGEPVPVRGRPVRQDGPKLSPTSPIRLAGRPPTPRYLRGHHPELLAGLSTRCGGWVVQRTFARACRWAAVNARPICAV